MRDRLFYLLVTMSLCAPPTPPKPAPDTPHSNTKPLLLTFSLSELIQAHPPPSKTVVTTISPDSELLPHKPSPKHELATDIHQIPLHLYNSEPRRPVPHTCMCICIPGT